jgi:hypothetical protein
MRFQNIQVILFFNTVYSLIKQNKKKFKTKKKLHYGPVNSKLYDLKFCHNSNFKLTLGPMEKILTHFPSYFENL